MKSVLLTGATGFVGARAIAPLIERGFTVHAVTSQPSVPTSDENVIWHRADLLDPSETKELLKATRPTHLLHFAWYVEHGKFWEAPENLDWIKASFHLVQQFVENGGKRIVATGSISEYAPKDDVIAENSRLEPQTLYAVSKAALYLTLEKYAKAIGVSFAWGRIFFLFGENEAPKRLVASVTQALLKNEIAKTSHGNQIRDFMSTKEGAQAFVALLDSEVQGAVNVASGEARTIKEVVLQIADLIGNRENIEFGAIIPPRDEPKSLVADVTRLREEVKWKSSRSFLEQIEETVNWWKKELTHQSQQS
ncbi:MAG: NAD(P)-dependent oxidoreductase [Acidobacteriota bacterium]|nr:NAD(P)-dependent oxidoreductase [Acidobacteriota bacterium]